MSASKLRLKTIALYTAEITNTRHFIRAFSQLIGDCSELSLTIDAWLDKALAELI